MRATFKLLNSYFWKTIYGPIMAFIFPGVLLAILGNIFETKYVFPGIIAMATLFIAVLALPLGIMELRSSSLFKYIGASPVNPKRFSVVAIGFYILIIFAAVLILFGLSFALFSDQIFTGSQKYLDVIPGPNYPLTNPIDSTNPVGDIYHLMKPVVVSNSIFSNIATVAGFFQFLFANLVHILFSIMVGLTIATFAKTPQQALTTAIIIIIPSMFLSGMVVSVDVIASSKAMQWISRLIPFRYTTANLIEAATPLNQLGLLMTQDQQSLLVGDGGKVLRQMILTEQYPMINNSSSGIFDFTSSFTVRRVPNINQIRDFMIKYLSGGDTSGPVDTDTSRFLQLWGDISAGRWGWLELFLNQNNILYTQAEKCIDIFGPLLLAGGMGMYVTKNFKWSTR